MFKKIIAAMLSLAFFIPVSNMAFAQEGEECALLPIIMYHHVLKSPGRWGDYIVSPDTIEGDFKYLKERGYTAVGVSDLLAYAEGKKELPEKPVMITFDDGQQSFEPYVLPLLEKYDMRAVLGIVGSYADAYTENEDDNINYSYFSWPQLAALIESPRVELGVHSYDMHSLNGRQGCKIKNGESKTDYSAKLNADLDKAEERFMQYLHFKPLLFVYPYGAYCDEAQEILCQRGYKMMFTCDEHVNKLTGNPEDLLSLGRFNRANGVNREAYFEKLGIL